MDALIADLKRLIHKLENAVDGDIVGPPPAGCALTASQMRVLKILALAGELDPGAAKGISIRVTCANGAEMCLCPNPAPPPTKIIEPCPCR